MSELSKKNTKKVAPSDFRREFAVDVAERYDKILAVIDELMDAETIYKRTCPHCNRGVEWKFPDVRARADAVMKFVEAGFGKPGVQEETKKQEEPVDRKQLVAMLRAAIAP